MFIFAEHKTRKAVRNEEFAQRVFSITALILKKVGFFFNGMTDYNKYYVIDEEKLDKVRYALKIALAISESQYPHLKYKFQQARDFVSKDLESFRGSQNKPQTKKENI